MTLLTAVICDGCGCQITAKAREKAHVVRRYLDESLGWHSALPAGEDYCGECWRRRTESLDRQKRQYTARHKASK